MEIMLDGQLVTCTPAEYIELKRLGAFGDKPADQGAAPKLGEGYDEWLKRGMMDMVAVYGCESVLSPNATAGGNLPMLDGKHVYNPDTCTPGTMTCGDCIRDEYCEKARMAKKAAYEDRQRLAARPTIVKLTHTEIDPAGGYFHYFKLDADGKTYLNDNELEPWMVDAAISEQEFDARGSK